MSISASLSVSLAIYWCISHSRGRFLGISFMSTNIQAFISLLTQFLASTLTLSPTLTLNWCGFITKSFTFNTIVTAMGYVGCKINFHGEHPEPLSICSIWSLCLGEMWDKLVVRSSLLRILPLLWGAACLLQGCLTARMDESRVDMTSINGNINVASDY